MYDCSIVYIIPLHSSMYRPKYFTPSNHIPLRDFLILSGKNVVHENSKRVKLSL